MVLALSLFTSEPKQEFIESVKTGGKKRTSILESGMPLEAAFIYGYHDVSRAPLRGIGSIQGGAVPARSDCIHTVIAPFCREKLLKANGQASFDQMHEELCRKIREYYSQKGYCDFTVGKAQKWINMALKYACIYDEEDAEALKQVFRFCHVPVDRYIADSIVNRLGVALPAYSGFQMPSVRLFSAEKSNYSWSRIDNYEAYLNCQTQIKTALRIKSPSLCALEWEYSEWLAAKSEKEIQQG